MKNFLIFPESLSRPNENARNLMRFYNVKPESCIIANEDPRDFDYPFPKGCSRDLLDKLIHLRYRSDENYSVTPLIINKIRQFCKSNSNCFGISRHPECNYILNVESDAYLIDFIVGTNRIGDYKVRVRLKAKDSKLLDVMYTIEDLCNLDIAIKQFLSLKKADLTFK